MGPSVVGSRRPLSLAGAEVQATTSKPEGAYRERIAGHLERRPHPSSAADLYAASTILVSVSASSTLSLSSLFDSASSTQ